MNLRTLALAPLVCFAVGCADDERVAIPEASQTFGATDEIAAPGDPNQATANSVSYAQLRDDEGITITSQWRIGYVGTFQVRYCRQNSEVECTAWDGYRIEGFDVDRYSRPTRVVVTATVDGQDQFVTMRIDDASEVSHSRDCYVTNGVVDFGLCADWNVVQSGGI